MFVLKKWFLKNKKADFSAISMKYGINEVVARLIINRGVSEDRKRNTAHTGITA